MKKIAILALILAVLVPAVWAGLEGKTTRNANYTPHYLCCQTAQGTIMVQRCVPIGNQYCFNEYCPGNLFKCTFF